ncbi:zinc-binding dehydrogenase (plasmid) [Nicoliella spurrieriana]|uniref:Zinc-binding dehydrogenase n=1 Tax=Nicoliella spurrieriana TaxID=2925830 RepID=A0A976X4S2_9LACO|nr:zinc-binding dehydrogenase [Nicoliella spurrieriana]UQS86039.1 zinc-binding dehydrogenase [Nicoliella spurrieriana]
MDAVIHEGGLGVDHLSFSQGVETPKPNADEVLINLKSAGLNHHDLFVLNGHHDSQQPALIPGSDGAGVISEVGRDVREFKVGDEVIINPLLWGTHTNVPPTNMEVLGYPRNGTLADKVVISYKQVSKKPSYLDWTEAGVLSLSALTAYRAVFTKGQVHAGQRVFVPGAGGAVATNMIMMLKSLGATVIVSSRHQDKLAKAEELGADEVVLDSDNWAEKVAPVDIVIDDVGPATLNRDFELLKFGGTVVTFGSSSGDEITFDLRRLFFNQWVMKGSTGGTQSEFKKMLELYDKYQWHPVVDSHIFNLRNVKQGYELMMNKSQYGNIAVTIQK